MEAMRGQSIDEPNAEKLRWDIPEVEECCEFALLTKMVRHPSTTKSRDGSHRHGHHESANTKMVRHPPTTTWVLKTIHDDLLKTHYMIYHKLRIGYHEPLTNLMIFKLVCIYTIRKRCNHMCFFMIHEQNIQNFILFHVYGLKND
jgi:hypothetical protein